MRYTPSTKPEIVGRFMYHCHVLEHEDHDMMAQIEVYHPRLPADRKVNESSSMAGMR